MIDRLIDDRLIDRSIDDRLMIDRSID